MKRSIALFLCTGFALTMLSCGSSQQSKGQEKEKPAEKKPVAEVPPEFQKKPQPKVGVFPVLINHKWGYISSD